VPRVSSRPLSWVASILYAAVLVSGGYFHLAGLSATSPARTTGFIAVLLVLLVLDGWERWRYGAGTPRSLAVVLLAIRAILYVLASTLDDSGFARALILLIPFAAYFTLGRRAAYLLAAGCLGLVLLGLPGGWYRDQETLSDLLMFLIGLVFALSMAAVAAEEQIARSGLEESHRQLTLYATQAASLAAATERNRLARDIHDSLGHHLTAVSVQLEKAAVFRHRDEVAAEQALADARRSARYALEDVRHSVGSLRDGVFSLRTALVDLVRTDTAVVLETAGDETGYAGPTLMALYRVAQEGLTNVRRHAAAGSVTLRLELGPTEGRLIVADNGRGFRVDVVEGGFGLRGMRERLELFGGTLTVESAPDNGTRLVATVPAVVPMQSTVEHGLAEAR
jgi:signal transduction histidine kinase